MHLIAFDYLNKTVFFFLIKPCNSRSVAVAKVNYQDSMRDQMAVANPNTTGLKTTGT